MKRLKKLITIGFIIFSTTIAQAQEVPLLLPKPTTPVIKTQAVPATKATQTQPSSQPVAPNTEFANCTKIYTLSAENLFLLTLSAISSNNYKINEIQSKNGYILFSADKKEFLAGITKINNQISSIKISPANNNYAFSQNIIDKLFKYISENAK